jgi:predicted enzyme related to lactoylglutathione lyase
MTWAMTKFCRFDLRTTDAGAARAFYGAVFGHDRSVIWPLHEQALARGARPHWLGHIAADDVERTAEALVERGAMRLGPTVARDGGQVAVLRDPGGAMVAVAALPPSNAATGLEAAWHVLHTNDAPRAAANYAAIFGWLLSEPIELGAQGVLQEFTWAAGGASAGGVADIAGRPRVHPHWLFFFEVDALDRAIAAVRAAGGVVIDSVTRPSGERVCVSDDPQGAAFALQERRAPASLPRRTGS